MNETATLVLAIGSALVMWTASVVSMVWWLASKFRSLEQTIYREMDKHRREDDRLFEQHRDRLVRLEFAQKGWSEIPEGRLP